MRYATLISWLVTVSLGGFMLRTWLARGGLHRERARKGGLPPQLIFGHAAGAIVGLLLWVAYLAVGPRPLAWAAVILLMMTASLGLCTVTLWTPYPARKPGERREATRWDEPSLAVPDTVASIVPDVAALGTQGSAEEDNPADFQVTDEMITRLLNDPGSGSGGGAGAGAWHGGGWHGGTSHRPIRPNPAVLVPVAHGFAAIGTLVLAVMTASM